MIPRFKGTIDVDREYLESSAIKNLSPEQKMILAAIKRAVLDSIGIVHPTGSHIQKSRVMREAREWVWSNNTERWSYNWCCDVIDLEPSWFLRLITGMKINKTKKLEALEKKAQVLMEQHRDTSDIFKEEKLENRIRKLLKEIERLKRKIKDLP